VWLAAQDPGVAGVVLHSPLLSGVRVLRPTLKYWPAWADIYPNHLLVGRIKVGGRRVVLVVTVCEGWQGC
jgi:alpha-beta hydrolase superfamily lysophospholipase